MMGGMELDIENVVYQGPAVLVPRDEDREYPVGVRIHETRDVGVSPDTGEKQWDIRGWNADVDGHFPAPPYGDCVLRLPDGREGKAVFSRFSRTSGSTMWEGRLDGRGPSPTAEG